MAVELSDTSHVLIPVWLLVCIRQLSHTAVPSALMHFTSLFGKGRGGSTLYEYLIIFNIVL